MTQDDILAARAVSAFYNATTDIHTLTKITACYNIMIGLINLCSVCGQKKDIIKLINEYHEALLEHIETINWDGLPEARG